MAKVRQWIITVSHDQSIHNIASGLAAKGLTIKDVLEEIGCITGSAEDSAVNRLKKVKGVVDIAPDMQIDLGPPDAEDTW